MFVWNKFLLYPSSALSKVYNILYMYVRSTGHIMSLIAYFSVLRVVNFLYTNDIKVNSRYKKFKCMRNVSLFSILYKYQCA